MSKQDLNNELQSWISSEDFSPDRDRITSIQEQFEKLRSVDEEKARAAAEEAEDGDAEGFQYKPDELDNHFKELLDIYNDKRRALDKEKREQEKQNHQEKKDLIKELDALIKDEENIGKAYKRFDAIKQKWNEIGPVPQAEKRDLQADYSRLIEQFYYNINIYRELQINDLKKNQELKLEVISKIKMLEDEKSVNQVDFLLHQYLEEWDKIGPTFKEEWDEIREDYKAAISSAFDRIKEHRKQVREEHKENYDKKEVLVNKVKELSEKEFNDVKAIQQMTKEVIQTQKEWKHIGYAGRKKNDSIWEEFRAACDAYFAKRNSFIESNNKEFEKVREIKKQLINRAKEIYEGEDRGAIADELKGLQRRWKHAGKLMPQEEYRMFKEFRKYCDEFFNRKKKEDKEMLDKLNENLKKKEEFLKGIAEVKEAEIKEKGEAIIEEWKNAWIELGEVPRKTAGKVEKTFQDALNQAYKHLGISKSEVAEKQFENKLEILSQNNNAEGDLRREFDSIRKQIKDMEMNKLQLENKLDFFTFSDDSNPLKKDLLDRIAKENAKIDQVRQKKKKVELMIKELKKAETAQSAEVNAEGEKQSED